MAFKGPEVTGKNVHHEAIADKVCCCLVCLTGHALFKPGIEQTSGRAKDQCRVVVPTVQDVLQGREVQLEDAINQLKKQGI